MNTTLDRQQRSLRDLRISVTDRCNFRCRYCMPREMFGKDYPFLSADRLLAPEEIVRLARLFVALGVRKLRITGGEPLLRRGIEDLIAELAALDGVEEVALTTNGTLLAARAEALKAAGLRWVTVSLDALDETVFRAMSDTDLSVARVLEGIDAARAAGLGPVKVNAVVQRGVNENQIVPLARHFRGTGCILRFIEYMDVGGTNGWRLDQMVSADEILARLEADGMPVEAVAPAYPGEVANRYRYVDGTGEVGVIASVTRPFCGDCTRARLSAEGKLYTCLFATDSALDPGALLRQGVSEAEITEAIRGIWTNRSDRYSELRSRYGAARAQLPMASSTNIEPAPRRVEMSYIGG